MPRRLPEFWSLVDASGDCWLWTGSMQATAGYGRYGESVAHRFAYEALVGPIPADLTLDHLCRVRSCVNPDHLEPVTARVNTLRGVGVGALNARKTECKRGHPFTEQNTRITPSGRRYCRECARQTAADYRARDHDAYLAYIRARSVKKRVPA